MISSVSLGLVSSLFFFFISVYFWHFGWMGTSSIAFSINSDKAEAFLSTTVPSTHDKVSLVFHMRQIILVVFILVVWLTQGYRFNRLITQYLNKGNLLVPIQSSLVHALYRMCKQASLFVLALEIELGFL